MSVYWRLSTEADVTEIIINFVMNNIFFVIIALGLILKGIELKLEYFPSEMRWYEDGYERYAKVQIYRRYYSKNPDLLNIPAIKNPYIGER